jgi:hypothetical protein
LFERNTNAITLVKRDKLHKTSLAHELFHYFNANINGKIWTCDTKHEPLKMWQKLFGLWVEEIGSVNETLKTKGF